MIIVFAGCDKTGKSTLIRKLHKATHYKYPILDRFTESSIVYGLHNNRKLDYEKYFELEKYLLEEVLLVYIEANKDDIGNRMKIHNEKDIKIDEIEKIKKLYEDYLNETCFNYIVINTSAHDEKACIEIIKNKIKEIEKEDGLAQVNRLIETIMNCGEKVNNTTELRNINYNFKNIKFKRLKYFTNTKQEKYYYDRIYYSLRHIINAQMTEYHQNIYSRKYIFTSNECINSFHVLFRNDILECYIAIRSSDVLQILPLDIYYSYQIAKKINKEYFKAKKIKLNFKIASAHVYL